jgi:hypothetical protein
LANSCSNITFEIYKYKDNTFSFEQYWTDKSYVWGEGEEPTGANRVAHTINDTRIVVNEIGVNENEGTWKIVFTPTTSDYKLRLDSYSLPSNPPHKDPNPNRDFFTWTLPLYASCILFPSFEMPRYI